ncbi:MAG TPA: Gmad2 immunoglobulin-like domain-containing protein [Chitinophagaceae bacterium]|nr:Gmad2 immunoglobulin-like domain-containing protein [Chitinophagaceae bacterium]
MKEIKYNKLFIALLCIACNTNSGDQKPGADTPGLQREAPPDRHDSDAQKKETERDAGKTYQNQRFRNVTIDKTAKGTYTIEGQAQMFEADFGWVVNKGEEEIMSGYESTDAGAPSWGNFKFSIKIEEKHLSSPLVLVLYESSAKDGSRQHQLNLALD